MAGRGPPRPLSLRFPSAAGELELSSYSLALPLGEQYEQGELLTLGLRWQRGALAPPDDLVVVVQLTTPEGLPLLENERPLLYGAFPPSRWPAGVTVEHVQSLALPTELLDGRHGLAVGLRAGGVDLGSPQPIATIEVASQGGMSAESGHFVPATFSRAWAELGGMERAGLALTPAVPFTWGHLQCFERVCLELREGVVRQRPLGTKLYLAETTRGEGCGAQAPAADGFCPGFAEAPWSFAELGAPISGEFLRNGWLVQWTEYGRLERSPEGGAPGLGRLGDESLRLPPGTPYRWP